MDNMNLQNFLVNQTPMAAFAEKSNVPTVRQPQQKTDSFASKLNNAVARSASATSGTSATSGLEAAQPPADMEKTAVFNNETNIINETQPKQAVENSGTDCLNTATVSEKPLVNKKPEIHDEFLGVASLMVQTPSVANVTSENTSVQLSTLQANFFLNLSERPGLSLTAEELKGLYPDAKISETMFFNANSSNKGQIISQIATSEPLLDVKQDMDVLTAKGELPKITVAEPNAVLQQSNDTAKQLQARLQHTNPTGELANSRTELPNSGSELVKSGVELPKLEVELVKPGVELPKLGVELVKPGVELAKPEVDPTKPVVEPTKPGVELLKLVVEPTKPGVELLKPVVEPTKPEVELLKLGVELAKPVVEPTKLGIELLKPGAELPKPVVEPTKPGVELLKPEIEPTKPGIELVKPGVEPTKPGVELVKPGVEPTKPGVELVKPEVEPAKPGIELVKPGVEPTKPFVEPAKPGVELVKPVIESPKPVVESAKPGVELVKPVIESPKPVVEPAKPGVELVKPVIESSKPVVESAKTVVESPKPAVEPAKPGVELVKPVIESPKPEVESAKPEVEPVKSVVESAKPEVGLIKPGIEPVKPAADIDVAKPVVEIAKVTVTDTAKPAVEIVRPNEQPQPTTGETSGLTLKATAEQNLADRQNTGGQQSFNQMMESKAEQIKNPDQQPSQNNNHTFAISFDTATQSTADKPGATQTQQTAADFAAPRDEFQIKTQIVQQATLINRSAQESEMLIRLKPEHLGELALKVTVANGVVNASFHSNNAEVRSVLENSIQQLKNELANAGFKVDNVSISAGLGQFTADQERTMQWQQQQNRRVSGKNATGYAEPVEGVAASQPVINSSKDAGVDYRI